MQRVFGVIKFKYRYRMFTDLAIVDKRKNF